VSKANVRLARNGYAAIARGDLDAVAELLAPDVRWHGGDPDAEGACRNREQALAFVRNRAQASMGELVDVIDAGDSVVVVMQPAAQGGETAPRRANVTSFRDGQVVEMIAFESPEAALAHVARTRRDVQRAAEHVPPGTTEERGAWPSA
jgi:ketosteroid isomerase-like protein